VKASKKQILEELKNVVIFRPNFKKLAKHCKENRIPCIIVSAGLDFVIKHFLKLNGCLNLVEVCAAKTVFGAQGIRFVFPTLIDTKSENFKHDMVIRYKSQNMEVIYAGDGLADYAAARDSDYSFTIRNSRLARLCMSHEIRCRNITDFQDVIEAIRKIEPGKHTINN
jgi:2-hydroxy-3-keto-5-methylthiopentenyl-1-phosphate phosphatase